MTAIVAKWTLEEYHRMVESGVLDHRRVELIKGEIVEMPPEGEPHAYSISESGEYLSLLLGHRAKVRYGNPINLPDQSETCQINLNHSRILQSFSDWAQNTLAITPTRKIYFG